MNAKTTYPDWIEIQNRGTTAVNLGGWHLTDDPCDLTKWAMPAIQIAPGGFLVVYASGILQEDHPENWPYRDTSGSYHTNFTLDGEGEYLALVSPDVQVVHEYGSHTDGGGFPVQRFDLSYGLYGNQQQYFSVPTPGRANNPGAAGISDEPIFSREAGTYAGMFLLELRSPNPAAEIRYTLDGQTPTLASIKYTDPIPIVGTREVDALRLSTHLHKDRDGKLEMGPLWDFDRALDSTDGRDNNAQSWHGTGDGTGYHQYVWWNRLFEDKNFWQGYIDRWYMLRKGPFSTASLNATIDAMADEIREAQDRNYKRWTSAGPRFGGFQGEMNHLKQWLQTRCTWIDSQFVAPPQIVPAGGRVEPGATVTLVNPHTNGVLYYTLDGSDPRPPSVTPGLVETVELIAGRTTSPTGNGISEAVHVYTGPIPITESTQIKARVLVANNPYSPWSGLAQAIVDVGPGAESLRINEIMYNPDGSADAEYVELLNISDSPIMLHDTIRGVPWRFSDNPDDPAIDVLFPADPPVTLAPGEGLLLVKNLVAFQAVYSVPPHVQILEWGNGRLANSGDTIQISSPGDENADGTRAWVPAESVTYSDGSHAENFAAGVDPWPTQADGRGMALSRIDPEADGNAAADWRATPPSPGVVK